MNDLERNGYPEVYPEITEPMLHRMIPVARPDYSGVQGHLRRIRIEYDQVQDQLRQIQERLELLERLGDSGEKAKAC